MAEIYPMGENRIFYRPQGFTTGLILSVEIFWEKDLAQAPEAVEILGEFNTSGLYYFDYTFTKEGTYIGIFYENGEKTTSQAFSTRRIPAKGFSSSPGSNVINI